MWWACTKRRWPHPGKVQPRSRYPSCRSIHADGSRDVRPTSRTAPSAVGDGLDAGVAQQPADRVDVQHAAVFRCARRVAVVERLGLDVNDDRTPIAFGAAGRSAERFERVDPPTSDQQLSFLVGHRWDAVRELVDGSGDNGTL